MKMSVSLSYQDVAFIDRQIAGHGDESRSAVIRRALRRLRDEELAEAYRRRWTGWGEEESLWDATTRDGLERDSE